MRKIDVEATIAELRKSNEELERQHPSTHPVERACNIDGFKVIEEFVRWRVDQTSGKLDPQQYVEATGMLLGQLAVMSIGALPSNDYAAALVEISSRFYLELRRFQMGDLALVKTNGVTHDVGDA